MSEIQIIILAGGLGTRLRPLTETVPKAMIPIHQHPFVHYQLNWLSQCGIRDVILSTGYLGDKIRDYVKEGKAWNLSVRYVDEGKDLRGTAGALRLIFEQGLLNEKFLVTYGDSFLPIDFKAVWNRFSQGPEPALMTVLRNHEKWDQSNACFDGQRVTLYDKTLKNQKPEAMQFIDYGLSGLSRYLIESEIPTNTKSDLADLFHRLSLRNELAGDEVHERFYEIGSMSGIQDLEDYFRNHSFGHEASE